MRAPRRGAATVRDDWQASLANAVAAALRELEPQLKNVSLRMLAIDCHPWNGFLGLAVLTDEDVDGDPLLDDPAEMAAWPHYDCGEGLKSWRSTQSLARAMRDAYASGDRGAVVGAFLTACAGALASSAVGAALDDLTRGPKFRLSVAHPDTGKEFVKERPRSTQMAKKSKPRGNAPSSAPKKAGPERRRTKNRT